ncbi:MAG: glycosyltransferase family A protein [Actinomycetota bacterium]|nr:glycosyltransferase family A protein [Actinomycetota bacterium]MDP2287980.1 glycosyltransferase family A protein [Actinomycetota bacterium]
MNLPQTAPTIVVGICAYKKAEGLHTLLTALAAQETSRPWRLVLVDNDPEGSAKEIFDRRRGEFSVPTEYIYENAGRLVAARNAILDKAAPHESVLYIDDDCAPDSGWLEAFACAAEKFPDAVLAGPLTATLMPGVTPPEWSSNMWFFNVQPYSDGDLVGMAADGNALLPPKLIHVFGLRFEPYFDAGRGQDTDLFLRWKAQGGEIRWVSGGHAIEWIPQDRTTTKYLRARSLAAGYGFTRINLYRRTGRARRLATTGVDLVAGTARYIAGAARRDANARGRAVYDLSIGVGSVRAFAEQGREIFARRGRRG